MKKLLAIVLTVFSMSIYAGSLEVSPAPDVMLNAGVTIPEDGATEKSGKAGVSVGALANFVRVEGVGSTFNELQLFSVGVSMQEGGKFNYEVAPVSVKTLNGFTYGVSFMPKKDDRRGGSLKLFIGITF